MSGPPEQAPTRKTIVRHVLIFQVKLWLEGFKDVVLMPLSFGAALLDLVFRRGAMYSVMRAGNRFERWVDLYAALEDSSREEAGPGGTRSLDALLNEAADGLEKRQSKEDGDMDDPTSYHW